MVQSPSSEPQSSFGAAIPKDARTKIIDALMELAGERRWEDISLSEIASRAGVTLSEFRDHFPSKGAVLAAFSRRLDKTVLERGRDDLVGEPAKERLFDVLMRRLDAMAPYKNGLETVLDWARRDPLTAAALNRTSVNSMRFMLEAAGIDTEGAVGALKLQGLVFAWTRILDVWFRDEDPDLSKTMAALDRELTRGGKIIARAEDIDRLASPLRSMASALFDRRRRARHSTHHRARESWRREEDDPQAEVY
ncbi:MAG TPA: helix-turn-helix domain-containing protein [Beijerinckiaceae bacterium]|nr:helix-turn-helix domain-containing protein [Beijerinckiaceae bacterium]